MNRLLFLLSLFLLPYSITAQVSTQWAYSMGCDDTQDYNEDNAFHVIDSSGNIYMSTSYPTTVDFDPSAAVFNLTSNGGQQSFVAKYDADGNFIWAKNIPETSGIFLNAMAADANGNLYITGSFSQPTDMDPSAGVTTITPVGTDAQSFLAKYDSNGDLVWVKQHNSAGFVKSRVLVLDKDDNIYEAGYVSDSIDLDMSASDASFTGWNATYIAKYTNDGDYIWGGIIDSLFTGGTDDIRLLPDGDDLFISTKAYWDLDVDLSPSSVYLMPGSSNYDHMVLKYNSDGEIQWGFKVGGSVNEENLDIAVDENNVYLVANFYGTLTNVDPQNGSVLMGSINGASNLFLASYDRSDYNFNWGRRIVSSPDDSKTFGIYLNGNSLIIGGTYRGTTDFDPSSGQYEIPTSNFESLFLASYDKTNGDFEWVESNDDPVLINSFTYEASNKRIVLAGGLNTTRNVSFDPTPVNLSVNGNNDMLLASYTDLFTELPQSEEEQEFTVFPNPFQNKLTVQLELKTETNYQIFNSVGQLVAEGIISSNTELDLEHLSSGTYTLQLLNTTGTLVKQIIKL